MPSDVTVLRLARALRTLAELEDVLGTETPLSDAANEVQKAILDLCGVPEDTTTQPPSVRPRCCRDEWAFAVNEIAGAGATDEELETIIPRLRKISELAASARPN